MLAQPDSRRELTAQPMRFATKHKFLASAIINAVVRRVAQKQEAVFVLSRNRGDFGRALRNGIITHGANLT
jgi:hypothetical protein